MSTGDKYLYIDSSGNIAEKSSTETSAGGSSAGLIVALNSSGLIDTSMLPPSGSNIWAETKVTTTSYSVLSTDGPIISITAGSPVTLTLPPLSGVGEQFYWIRNEYNGADITVNTATGTDKIDNGGAGLTSLVMKGVVNAQSIATDILIYADYAKDDKWKILYWSPDDPNYSTTLGQYIPAANLSGVITAITNSDGTITVTTSSSTVSIKIPSSVNLPGNPTTTTATAGDNSTKIATTAFVSTAITNANGPVINTAGKTESTVPNPVVMSSGMVQPLPYPLGFSYPLSFNPPTNGYPAANFSTNNNSPTIQAICAGPDGNIWYTDTHGPNIWKLTLGGILTNYSVGLVNVTNLLGICAGPDDNIWFIQSYNNAGTWSGNIIKMSLSGSTTTYALPANSQPTSICAGPDGSLWYTNSGTNSIGKCTTSGTVTEYSIPSATCTPTSICSGPDGRIWFTETTAAGATGKVGAITTGGTITEYSLNKTPYSICAGSDGNLWVTSSPNYVSKISTSGSETDYTMQDAGTQVSSGIYGAICAGPDGNIWYLEQSSGRVVCLKTNGTSLPTTYYGLGSTPSCMCVGSDGGIWIAVGSSIYVVPITVNVPNIQITSGTSFNQQVRLYSLINSPVDASDRSGISTLYVGPYGGSTIVLKDTNTGLWIPQTFSQVSVSVPSTTNQMYDVFVQRYSPNSISATAVAWTNDTTRSTALAWDNGFPVLSSDHSKLYVGSFRTSSVAGQTNDSSGSRLVSSYFNPQPVSLFAKDTTASWSYALNTWRSANNNTTAGTGRTEFISCVGSMPVNQTYIIKWTDTGAAATGAIGIALDSTTSAFTAAVVTNAGASYAVQSPATYNGIPSAGYHYVQNLETSNSGATISFIGSGSMGGNTVQYAMQYGVITR